MAREYFARIGRPSGLLLLLCICLSVPTGWMVLIGSEGAVTGPAALRSGIGARLDPPASLPLPVGAAWRYLKGQGSGPAAGWNTVGFDDAAWLQGPSGFGYGDGDDATVLSDMQANYLSVYIRREFTIPDVSRIAGLRFSIDYDDGFVAYVNGAEFARSVSMGGVPGTAPAYNAAAGSHEAVAGGGGPIETFTIPASSLVTGTNVLAIQAHNSSLSSTDLSLIPTLEVLNAPPAAPSDPSPSAGETGVPTSPQLCVTASDPEGSALDVTFHGREAAGPAGDPFTLIALPDTQYYSATYPATYAAQTRWIRDNRLARNIVFVTGVGDCTDQGGIQAQWDNANAALTLLEDPLLTGLPDGVPFGLAVGNHDQSPNGLARSGSDENVTTTLYNQTFGRSRFAGRGYFGDNYPQTGFADSMDNHYELFSASGMNFIIFHLEWDDACSWPASGAAPAPPLTTCQSVLTWVRDLLSGPYATRRALITSHWMGTPTSGGTGTPAFSTQGQAIFNAVKTLPNVFLMLGGHLDQGDHRTDPAVDGHSIHTLIADFQSRPNGGNGWLRIMTFQPQTGTFHVETYSPTLDRYIDKLNDGTPSSHADNLAPGENDITLDYPMDSGSPMVALGTDSAVPSGSRACVSWPGLRAGATYEWDAVVSDGSAATAGTRWSFTTASSCTLDAECDDGNACTADACTDSACTHAAIAGCCLGAADCDDANVCTDDSCVANACVHADNTGACSDGNACTTADTCSGGACVPGPAASCDDGNACTTDSCATLTGCAHAYTPSAGCCATSADCSDGNPATIDVCAGGTCSNGAPASCASNADCNDGDQCVVGTCHGLGYSLALNGTSQYVTMGAAPGLDSARFTVEAWFRRNASPGTAASTGTGGITAVPLVAKGAAQSEAATLNMNYFLGLRDVGGGVWRLAADFEEGSGGAGPLGLNHPVTGTLTVDPNGWHHAAATYDGATWSLYLDGNLDTTLAVNQPAASDSIQHFGIGTTLTSTGTAAGFFGGRIDEVRVWSVARTQAEIQADMNREVTSGTGLIGRWGFSEGSGTTASDSVSPGHPGTLAGGPLWDADTPLITAGTCSFATLNCDDGNVCTTDSCAPATGCAHAAGNDGASCDDGDACTTGDLCAAGVCAGAATGACCTVDADCDDFNACTANHCAAPNAAAVSFDGADDYIAFGAAATHPELGLSRFTIECWFRKTGTGVEAPFASSAPGSAVPLVARGRGVGDGGTFDLNYFLGIAAGSRVVFSFEQIEATAGADNIVYGTANIDDGVWHHAAVTYDGATLRLFVDGLPDGTLATTTTPRWDSIHRLAIGSSYNDCASCGTNPVGPAGYFAGQIDEVRIWSAARTQAEIAAGMSRSIETAPGLVGRWGMNEGSGLVAGDTALGHAGTLTNGASWTTSGLVDFGAGVCQFTPTPGASCNDANLCMTGDTCDASGACQPGPTPLDCDDLNVCTDDACDNELGCVHYNNQSPCSDGNLCTTVDVCDGGVCVGGAPLFCDDGVLCNGAETCHPLNGCVAGTPLDCDDGNPCTVDSCDASGCVHVEDGAVCDDGNACTADLCAAVTSGTGLAFDGANDYVTFGTSAELGLSRFTIETWFKRTGAGVANTTGNGGIASLVPLIAKGAPEADGSNVDADYILGINTSGNVLAADFEDTATGLNHPVSGTTPIVNNTWYHAAASYDGTTWRLYLDGHLEATLVVGAFSPRSDSVQPAGLGTMQRSVSNPGQLGFFAGVMDEVRIWDHARSDADIDADHTRRILSAGGLVARWGLDEGAGSTAADSAAVPPPGSDGTLVNFTIASAWVAGAPALQANTCSYASVAGCCLSDAACDDGNVCTDEACNLLTHQCEFADNQASCSDGDACTAGDVCSGGSCSGAPIDCDDGNACTTDSCGGGACSHLFSPTPGCCAVDADCNDGDPGTTDACAAGSCTNTLNPACTGSAGCNDGSVCTADSCVGAIGSALKFNGTSSYVTMGRAKDPNQPFPNGLGAAAFTLEAWIRRDGATWGTGNASTGAGGLQNVVALIAKGRSQSDGDPNDCNYFLGIDPASGRLVADFEQYSAGPGGWIAGLNHPACSSATIPSNDQGWHHVAVTYDKSAGKGWRFYLDGAERTAANGTSATCGAVSTCANDANCPQNPGVDPRYDSDQHFALGVALNSAGANPGGWFGGVMDEARVWNRALSQADIQAGMFAQVTSAAGLIGRWGLNESAGTTAGDSTSPAENGTLSGAALPVWTADRPLLDGRCSFAPANEGGSCSDGNACTQSDSCRAGACVGGGAVSCSDGDLCTSDSCDTAAGCLHTPVPVDDGSACTIDACDPATGAVTHTAITCDDGLFCNGAETCDPASGCVAGVAPACDDGVACTLDSCNETSDQCVHDAAACTADILGTIRYYRDASAGAEPSAKPVSGVTVSLGGTGPGAPDQVTTPASGGFGFTGKPINETYSVSPSKSGDFLGAVSSFDAALVARSMVGLTTLSSRQQVAADASGNGSLSSMDASYIAQLAVGLITRLPASTAVGGDWFLIPVPAPAPNQTLIAPDPAAQVNGAVTFTPLVATAAGQDFLAGLFGDVSGNWSNVAPLTGGGPASLRALEALGLTRTGRAGRVALSPPTARADKTIEVAIGAQGAEEALSFDLDLAYDSAAMTPIAVKAGAAAGSFTLTSNLAAPGHARFSLFGPQPLGASGDLVVVTFRLAPGARKASRLSLSGVADEGTLPLTLDSRRGRVRSGR